MNDDKKIVKGLHRGDQVSSVYPIDNLNKQKEEVIYHNRYVQSLPSLAFGSSSQQLNIPNTGMPRGVVLSVQLPAATYNACPGYNMIESITWRIHGSSQYVQSGRNHFVSIMDQCETQDKRNELISLAGGNADGTVQAAPFWVHMWVNLPYSKIRAMGRKKYPLDITHNSQPLTVQFAFKQNTAIISSATPPVAFLAAQWQIVQGELLDRSHRVDLADGRYLNYPMILEQDIQTASVTPAATTTVNTVNLVGFRAGEAKSLILYVCDDADIATKLFKTKDITDVTLLFNGQVLYTCKGDSHRLLTLEHNKTPNSITMHGASQYYLQIPLAGLLPKQADYGVFYQNGMNFGSQTLQLQFSSPSTAAQTVYGVINYGASILMTEGNSEVVVA